MLTPWVNHKRRWQKIYYLHLCLFYLLDHLSPIGHLECSCPGTRNLLVQLTWTVFSIMPAVIIPSSLLAFLQVALLPNLLLSNDIVQQKHLLLSNHTDRMRVSSNYTCNFSGIVEVQLIGSGTQPDWRPIPKIPSFRSATVRIAVISRLFSSLFLFWFMVIQLISAKKNSTQTPKQSHFIYKWDWGLAVLCATLDKLLTAFERTKLTKLLFLRSSVWYKKKQWCSN